MHLIVIALFLFLFFLVIFWKTCRSFPLLFSMLLVEVQGSKMGLVSLDALENSCFGILLIFQVVQNAYDQVKYKQTLKHARKVHAVMYQAHHLVYARDLL